MTLEEAMQIAVQHHQAGRLDEAAAAFVELGIALARHGKTEGAAEVFGRAIQLRPDHAAPYNNLGRVLYNQGKLDAAVAAYSRAIQLNPNIAEIHVNLGNVFKDQKKLDEAEKAFNAAISLNPNIAEAHGILGSILREQGKLEAAFAANSKALQLDPRRVEFHNNIGNVMREQGNLDGAIAAFSRAIELKGDCAEAHSNLAVVLKDQGRLDEAIAAFRKAIDLDPGAAHVHSNLCMTLQYHPDQTGQSLLRECLKWDQQHAQRLKHLIRPHENDASPERRLRVGYISPDLRQHAVGRMLLPLLTNHNHSQYEIYCYSDVPRPDDLTERARKYSPQWRDIVGISNHDVAECIRRDRIDILVDLAAHGGNNRLLVFARKPAPIQVTFLGSPGTVGVETIEYRLSDPYLDPPAFSEEVYIEKTMRLPHCYWCYAAPPDSPEVAGLPAITDGRITFGCFNNFCKITQPTIRCWISLMQSISNSRLMIYAQPGSHCQRFAQFFTDAGIDSSRLEFTGGVPMRQYLDRYNSVDIALDPFPFGGGTTTCDALWMGVPTLTLAGPISVGRGGVTLLTNVGLPDWIAHDPAQYISIARKWAANLPALAVVRASLRERMKNSPLMDRASYAVDVENAYRMIWRTWCKRNAS